MLGPCTVATAVPIPASQQSCRSQRFETCRAAEARAVQDQPGDGQGRSTFREHAVPRCHRRQDLSYRSARHHRWTNKGTQIIDFGTGPQSFGQRRSAEIALRDPTINGKHCSGEVGVSVLLNKWKREVTEQHDPTSLTVRTFTASVRRSQSPSPERDVVRLNDSDVRSPRSQVSIHTGTMPRESR